MIRVILFFIRRLAHALGLGLGLGLVTVLWLAFALPVVAVRLLVVPRLGLGLLVRVSLESYGEQCLTNQLVYEFLILEVLPVVERACHDSSVHDGLHLLNN